MRKAWLIFISLILTSGLSAQNLRKIKEDPSYICGEGRGKDYESTQSAALDALVAKLASTDLLDVPVPSRLAVWKTYRGDILSASEVVMESGTALRYIPWKDVDRVFSRRRELVSDLRSRGAKAFSEGREGEAAACAEWALALLDALPDDPDMRASLESLAKSSAGKPKADVPGLSYVGREVDSIRRAFGNKAPKVGHEASVRPSLPAKTTITDPEPEDRPVLAALPGISKGIPFKAAEGGDFCGISRLSTASVSHVALEKPSAKPAMACLLMVQVAALPSVEAGLMFGIRRNSFGGYLSARRGTGSLGHDYSASSDGRTGYGFLWASGKSRSAGFGLSGGALIGLGDNLSLYAGAGYGRSDRLWEDTSGRWARIDDLSHKGALVEAGAIYSFGHFSVIAGLQSITMSTISPVLGIGLVF
ncbi:MAG: hypothetical protein IJ840_01735 [Bacteroidales bacterium]|nr:hypothetical protein [Bacteroidales bacterium]